MPTIIFATEVSKVPQAWDTSHLVILVHSLQIDCRVPYFSWPEQVCGMDPNVTPYYYMNCIVICRAVFP